MRKLRLRQMNDLPWSSYRNGKLPPKSPLAQECTRMAFFFILTFSNAPMLCTTQVFPDLLMPLPSPMLSWKHTHHTFWFVAFDNFHGVNTLALVDFKLPVWCLKWSWKEKTHTGSLRGPSWQQLTTVLPTWNASVHFVGSVPLSSALGNLPKSLLVGSVLALISTHHWALQWCSSLPPPLARQLFEGSSERST